MVFVEISQKNLFKILAWFGYVINYNFSQVTFSPSKHILINNLQVAENYIPIKIFYRIEFGTKSKALNHFELY